LDVVAPLDGEEGQHKREIVLQTLVGLFREWLNEVAEEKGVVDEDGEDNQTTSGKSQQIVRGRIFCSGSYRLGINSPDGDIDTVCVVPSYVERSDFFSTFVAKLRSCVDVDSANPIEDAGVPIIELVISGVDVDIGIARAFSFMPVLPKQGETDEKYTGTILDDRVLCGGDMKDMFAMNGPRVTELIELIMQDSFETFKVVVRALRLWAKKRGIYSNKMGYLGGVNFNILGAFICQLYPNLSAGALLYRFFEIFGRQWAWRDGHNLPVPVSLLKKVSGVTDIGYDAQVWDGNAPHCVDIRRKHAVMPILTPAYPSSDSAYNVSFSTLRAMLRELHKGAEITSSIIAEPDPSRHDWALLFAPSDFFCLFDTYLVLELRADSDDDLDAFTKWVDSRVRLLVKDLEDPKHGLSVNMLTAQGHVRPWPKPEPKVDFEDKLVPDDYQEESTETIPQTEGIKIEVYDVGVQELKATMISAIPLTSLVTESSPTSQSGLRERNSEMIEESEHYVTESSMQDVPRQEQDVSLEVLQRVEPGMEQSKDMSSSTLIDLTSTDTNRNDEQKREIVGVPEVVNAVPLVNVTSLLNGQLSSDVSKELDSSKSVNLPDVTADVSALPLPSTIPDETNESPAPALLKRTIKVAVKKNCFYIGIKEDPEVRRKTRAKLGEQLKTFFDSTKFTKNRILSWPKLKEGMRVRVKVIAWKELPESVFPEGRELATVQRERIKEEEARAEAEAVAAVKAAKQSLSYVKGQTQTATPGISVPAAPTMSVSDVTTLSGQSSSTSTDTVGMTGQKRPLDNIDATVDTGPSIKKTIIDGEREVLKSSEPASAPVLVQQTKRFKVSFKK
jgi:poly(A) polymerase